MGRYEVHQKDGTQDALVAWCEARGCRYQHIGRPVDGLLCVPTAAGYLTVPVEWKTRLGPLRPSQTEFLSRWLAPAYVLRTEMDCAAMLAELRYPPEVRR